MKRFTVFTSIFSISALLVWAVLQVVPASKSSSAKANDNAHVSVYDATGEMLKAVHAGDNQLMVPVTGSDAAIPPVYDATGAMLEAIGPDRNVVTIPVYDATGAMQEAINPDKNVITIPAYDATGAMLDAISP